MEQNCMWKAKVALKAPIMQIFSLKKHTTPCLHDAWKVHLFFPFYFKTKQGTGHTRNNESGIFLWLCSYKNGFLMKFSLKQKILFLD